MSEPPRKDYISQNAPLKQSFDNNGAARLRRYRRVLIVEFGTHIRHRPMWRWASRIYSQIKMRVSYLTGALFGSATARVVMRTEERSTLMMGPTIRLLSSPVSHHHCSGSLIVFILFCCGDVDTPPLCEMNLLRSRIQEFQLWRIDLTHSDPSSFMEMSCFCEVFQVNVILKKNKRVSIVT